MNVEIIEMNPIDARAEYIAYRRRVKEHREARRLELARREAAGESLKVEREQIEIEDDELRRAYRALSRGQRILHLPRTMKVGGLDEQGRPRLAVARANWPFCFLMVGGIEVVFSRERWPRRGKSGRNKIAMASGVFSDEGRNYVEARALVPAVPARFRPSGDLSDYHILWEAKWEPAAPGDPILLKQISATTYAVLAQWDLSPLEQAILEGRLS